MSDSLGKQIKDSDFDAQFVEQPRRLPSDFSLGKLASQAYTRCSWDFSNALGDTMREKFESFYVKLVDVTHVVVKKGGKRLFSLFASPAVVSIFDSYTNSKLHLTQEQRPFGIDIVEVGVVHNRWRLYQVESLKTNECIICDERFIPEHAALMTISNFVV